MTSSKDAAGIGVLDLKTGSTIGSNFKNCLADPSTICVIGGSSCYSGLGSTDYLAVAQSKKTVINFYAWGKPQASIQCHVQEITTALACDSQGCFLIGGTKAGRLYCWEVCSGALLQTWQGHFKAITKIEIVKGQPFCVSSSEDGMVRIWDLSIIVDQSGGNSSSNSNRSTSSLYRSYSPHTLPVKGMCTLGSFSSIRIATCSHDRSAVLYDVRTSKSCLKVALPVSIESICTNVTEDILFCGGTNGIIYMYDLSETAISLSAAHAEISIVGSSTIPRVMSSNSYHNNAGNDIDAGTSNKAGLMTLAGHSRVVTGLVSSLDNNTLISVSEDGTLRMWDITTRQCIRELTPLAKMPLTNVVIAMRPEVLCAGVHKPTLLPLGHLKKYSEVANMSNFTIGPRLMGCLSNNSADSSCGRGSHPDNTLTFKRLGASKRKKCEDLTFETEIDSNQNASSTFSLDDLEEGRRKPVDRIERASVDFEQGDYVSLPKNIYDLAPPTNTKRKKDKNAERGVQIKMDAGTLEESAKLRKKLVELQSENARWKNVCAMLKEKVENSLVNT